MKWYVFDKYDCFDSYETVEAAAAKAKWMVESEFTNVHIMHLTQEEFDYYCKTGNFSF